MLAATYAAAGFWGQLLAIPPGNVTAFFPSSGIALAALVMRGRRLWPGVWLGSFLVNTQAFLDVQSPSRAAVTVLAGAFIGVGATVETLVAAHVFPPWDRADEAPLARVTDVARFTVMSALACAVEGASVGTTSLLASSLIARNAFSETWLTWWLGDAVGILVITPLILACSRWRRSACPGRGVELALHQMALITFQALMVLETPPNANPSFPLGHLITPFFIWAGVRLGLLGAALSIVNVAVVATWATEHGQSPFVNEAHHVSLLLVQVFVGNMALTTLILAAVMSERRRAEAALSRARDELDRRVVEGTAALTESEERYRVLVEVSPDASLLAMFADENRLQVFYANTAAARMLGAESPADLIGKAVFDFVPPDRKAVAKERALEVLAHGSVGPVEGRVVRLDGSSMDVELMLARVPRDGQPAMLIIFRDITKRKQIEEQRAALYRAAEESIRARDEFLAIASHELRTPLTSLSLKLQGLARNLQKDPAVAAAVLPALEVALRQTRRLDELVDELLDVSRITQGRLDMRIEDVDLSAVVEDVVERYRETAARAGCEVRLATDVVVGRWDRARLEQVFVNLLSNALKYGAGTPIDVRVRREGALATLSVQDRGIGIPAEDQTRIFERFERAAPVQHFSGFGLGLWIVRCIVEALGGTLAVESAPGEGSTFTVKLPCTSAVDERKRSV